MGKKSAKWDRACRLVGRTLYWDRRSRWYSWLRCGRVLIDHREGKTLDAIIRRVQREKRVQLATEMASKKKGGRRVGT